MQSPFLLHLYYWIAWEYVRGALQKQSLRVEGILESVETKPILGRAQSIIQHPKLVLLQFTSLVDSHRSLFGEGRDPQ